MKIIILSHWFLPSKVGGSERAVYHYAKMLSQRKHEVHVITQLDDKKLAASEVVEGFNVYRIKRWHLRILGTLYYFLQVYHKIRQLKPDVIHEQGISGLAFGIKGFLKIPYVVSPRGTELYLASGLYRKFIIRPALSNAAVRIALTQNMVDEMKRIFPNEVNIIPNGVDLARFEAYSRGDARQRLGIAEMEKIILCVANLRWEKGHEYLIEAMVDVSNSYPETRLFIVGDGPRREIIQNLVQNKGLNEKVVFTGFIPPDMIPEYMAAADVFVLPSLTEGFPNVLLEAMAAGLPIVATRVGGVPEIVTDGQNGFLAAAKDSQQLADKISLLLKDEDIRKQLYTNNIEKAKQHNWSKVVTALEQVYLKAKKH
ncbi:glycosyltransferase family 4 protein [Chloroflexota bacterium]